MQYKFCGTILSQQVFLKRISYQRNISKYIKQDTFEYVNMFARLQWLDICNVLVSKVNIYSFLKDLAIKSVLYYYSGVNTTLLI